MSLEFRQGKLLGNVKICVTSCLNKCWYFYSVQKTTRLSTLLRFCINEIYS